MSGYVRYAVYWLPEGELSDWGESWLGWSMAEGRPLPRPAMEGLPRSIEALTAAASVYGLHATIKPPFKLSEGQSPVALEAALAAFCRGQPVATAAGLALRAIDGFLALTPEGDTGAIDAMAAGAVAALDPFRAAAGPEELARRRAAGLSARQEAHLVRWGYPYVMEDFRFHVTLTGRMDAAEGAAVRAVLEPVVAPLLPKPLVLRGLALVGQDAAGFRLIARHDFGAVAGG